MDGLVVFISLDCTAKAHYRDRSKSIFFGPQAAPLSLLYGVRCRDKQEACWIYEKVSKLFAAREPMLFKGRFRTWQQGRRGPKIASLLTVPCIRLPGRGYLGRSGKQ